MTDSFKPEELIPLHGGYRHLKTFQIAQLVYDVTVRFCDQYIDRRSRTNDQMVQAARSGVQNIAEGSQVSGTSKKMEIKLTNVARASLEELRLDYEDFLRQRGQELWPPDHPSLMRFKNLRCKNVKDVQQWVQNERRLCAAGTHKDEQGNQPPRQNGVSVPANASPSAHVPRHAQFVANAALSLLNIGCYLLDRQIKAQAAAFEKEGGFTERLYRVRQQNRARPKNRRE